MSGQQFDDALHMMESLGGSFVRSLAHCCYMADATNRAKLREAFANYFDDYEAKFNAHRFRAAIADATGEKP